MPTWGDYIAAVNLVLIVVALFHVQRVHLNLNSRLDEMIKLVREEGRLAGMAEQRERGTLP
jgi:hypothetical protein